MKVNAINLCGGVSCNTFLQKDVEEIAHMYGVRMTRSPLPMCTDNAAMISWMGWELLNSGKAVNVLGENLQPHVKIPLGNYITDGIQIGGKFLRDKRATYHK